MPDISIPRHVGWAIMQAAIVGGESKAALFRWDQPAGVVLAPGSSAYVFLERPLVRSICYAEWTWGERAEVAYWLQKRGVTKDAVWYAWDRSGYRWPRRIMLRAGRSEELTRERLHEILAELGLAHRRREYKRWTGEELPPGSPWPHVGHVGAERPPRPRWPLG